MRYFDVAILGSGASGCMCSLTAPSGKSIAMIDKNKFPAKKLMATGNGRCNLTNSNIAPSEKYFNQNIDEFLKKFNQNDTLKFFQSLGLETYADEEGRIYPLSNSAKSVIDVINNNLQKMDNLTLFNEKNIKNIQKSGKNFIISLEDEEILAQKVVIATGGSSNNLLESLGVNCRKPTPSLCSLKTEKSTKLLNNVRISPVKVTAKTGSGQKYEEVGEVLFKEQGLSGIAIFNASAFFAREENFYGKISLDLMPTLSQEQVENLLKKRRFLDVKVSKFLDGLFVNQVAYYLFERCRLDENRSCKKMTDDEITHLAHTIKNLEFAVTDHYDNNQVFSGGALLSDLSNTLESKTIPNLYICGEACDVDSICGGYNLQWAWTSGYIVGRSL